MLALVGFIGLGLLVFGSNAAIMQDGSLAWYRSLTPPPLTPPGWVFAPVWAAIYVMIGVAAWLVWCRMERRPLRLWGWQLLLNALWTPAFFGLHNPGLALSVILLLLSAVVLTLQSFQRVDRTAMWLMVPYALWALFATYLTAGFWWNNAVCCIVPT